MAWFKRTDKGIQTPTEAKRDTPKGLWYKSPTGKIIETEELEKNFFVSPETGLVGVIMSQNQPLPASPWPGSFGVFLAPGFAFSGI